MAFARHFFDDPAINQFKRAIFVCGQCDKRFVFIDRYGSCCD